MALQALRPGALLGQSEKLGALVFEHGRVGATAKGGGFRCGTRIFIIYLFAKRAFEVVPILVLQPL